MSHDDDPTTLLAWWDLVDLAALIPEQRRSPENPPEHRPERAPE
jgi:hypothetical protein